MSIVFYKITKSFVSVVYRIPLFSHAKMHPIAGCILFFAVFRAVGILAFFALFPTG